MSREPKMIKKKYLKTQKYDKVLEMVHMCSSYTQKHMTQSWNFIQLASLTQ